MPTRTAPFFSIIAIILLLCTFTVSYAESNILDEAIAKATELQKPLLIEFVHDD